MKEPRKRILLKLSWQLLRLRFSVDRRKEESNRLLFNTFKGLGGIYVKFLQILVLDEDFLKGWAGPAEYDVFESVEFEQIDLPALLKAEMPDYEQHFLTIDLKPFAAGSFAQVYRGQLRDGTDVVLKILRPSLVQSLQADLRLLSLITRLTGLLSKRRPFNIRELYKQFVGTIRSETDYVREVKNAQWFYNYFAGNDDVVIPRTYANISGSRIIVQEEVGGISLAEVFQVQGQAQEPSLYVYDKIGSNIWTQLEIFGTELLIGILTAEFVIGDPHPGNVKLLPDNKIGLIDFGIAASAPVNRKAFLNLLKEYEKVYAGSFDAGSFTIAALQFFDEELTQVLDVAGQMLTPWEPRFLMQKIGDAARKALEDVKLNPQVVDLLDQKTILRLFNQSINNKNRFGVTISTESADMLKSAATCIKVVRAVGTPEQNFPVIYHGLQRAIAVAESGRLPEGDPAPAPRPEYALEFLSSWLASIADSDPFLYRQITGTINS
jgi:predicted unusual protein kinase regulating ubiquinone biosynthesis (AarF/ABC1/UbiB family)